MLSSRIVKAVETAITWITSAALVFCALYVVMAVIGPYLSLNLPDEDLLVAEAVVVVAFLPQLILVASDRQISVDLFVGRFPPRGQTVLDILASLCGLLSYMLLCWAGWVALNRALAFGSVLPGELGLVEWPARAVVVLGCAGGGLACLLRIAKDIQKLGSAR